MPIMSVKRQNCSVRYYLFKVDRNVAGNALWFCQNFFLFFLFFRHQGFRMITFDRQAGPLQNFNRSHVMVIGRSVSFSDPARPPGGGVGRPKHPKPPPLRKKAFQNPRNIFRLPNPKLFFFCVLRPQEDVFAELFFQLLKIPPPYPPTPPYPHPHAPAQPSEHSPQSWCNNKYSQQFLCEIWTTTTNTSNKYIKPAMSLYSLSINVHTISNPQYNDIICMLTNHCVWTMRWLRLRLHRLLECSRTIYNH